VYRRLLEYFPQSGNWPTEYALLARRAGKLEVAGKQHDLAMERDSEEFGVRYERGRFFEEHLEDLPRALNKYTEPSRIEPFSIKALSRQGSVLYRTKQWPKAIAAYSALIKLDPENPRVYYQRANGYFMEKQYQDAVLDYSQAIALKPDYKNAYQWRAACYERLGMPAKQQDDLRILKSLPQ
jgi:tetratricopeptide (TPR) repeat protein